MSATSTTLSAAVWPTPENGMKAVMRNAVLALAGTALIAVCARIQVPMWPVPMTMQVFAVLLIGLAYGARLGAATVALYVAQGAVGLPVFAGGGGLAYLAGPTGGFLFGFILAAAAAGYLADRGWGRPAVRIFAACVVGIACIYALGLPWLAALLTFAKGMTVDAAVTTAVMKGAVPFLVGDAVKAALAAVILPVAWRVLSRV
ncbi:MAG: biotin transporter BioY [Pseudomonadota bacterium]